MHIQSGSPRAHYRDLLAIETVATLNAGFCDYHIKHCPPSQQLLDLCKTVSWSLLLISSATSACLLTSVKCNIEAFFFTQALEIFNEAKAEIQYAEASLDCMDFHVS